MRNPLHLIDFNAEYTFNNFIASGANGVAKSMALAYAEGSNVGNAFVIRSTVGNGGTHLAFAILNEIKRINVGSNVFDTSYDSLLKPSNKQHIEFFDLDLLNSKDVILIDGFRNTGGPMYRNFLSVLPRIKTKLILTCVDDVPVPIDHLEARLVFPYKQDMKLILEQGLVRNMMSVPPDAQELLWSGNFRCVREMEGLLLELKAFSELFKVPVDSKLVLSKMSAHQYISEKYSLN